jgi:hypothetical protein
LRTISCGIFCRGQRAIGNPVERTGNPSLHSYLCDASPAPCCASSKTAPALAAKVEAEIRAMASATIVMSFVMGLLLFDLQK